MRSILRAAGTVNHNRPGVSRVCSGPWKILRHSAFVALLGLSVYGCNRNPSRATLLAALVIGLSLATWAGRRQPPRLPTRIRGEVGVMAKRQGQGRDHEPRAPSEVRQGSRGDPGWPWQSGGRASRGTSSSTHPRKSSTRSSTISRSELQKIIMLELNTAGEQFKSMVPKSAGGSGAPGKPGKPPPKMTKTGTSDKVAGYACDNWDVTEEAKKVATLCIADQSSSWFRLPLTGIPTEYAWALELLDGKHFPMRGVGYENGAEAGRVEVTKLEKKPLAASLFELPPSYKVIDAMTFVSGMMRGFGGMPGGMPAGLPTKKPK